MKGTLIISLDFELFWGMLEQCALENYQENILGGRKAIPKLLKLFEQYGIHATWATVGFLFGKNKQDLERFFPEEALRPTYEDKRLDPYAYFRTLGDTEEEAPCFFAPSLLRLVAETPGQEIGTHSFCHFYCREKGQTVEQFAADMQAAKAIAWENGIELTSVVLPRNHSEPEYTKVLQQCGFTAFRDEEHDWIHKIKNFQVLRAFRLWDAYFPLSGHGCYAPKCEDGMWNLIGSRVYRAIFPPLRCLEKLKLHRIKRQMLYAAKHGLTYHLWWHPHNLGKETDAHLAQLEELFQYFRYLQETYGMRSLNMREAAQAQE